MERLRRAGKPIWAHKINLQAVLDEGEDRGLIAWNPGKHGGAGRGYHLRHGGDPVLKKVPPAVSSRCASHSDRAKHPGFR